MDQTALDFIVLTREIASGIEGAVIGTIIGSATSIGGINRLIDKPVKRLIAAALLTAAFDLVEIVYYYLNGEDANIIAKAAQGDIGNTIGLYFGWTIGRRLHKY